MSDDEREVEKVPPTLRELAENARYAASDLFTYMGDFPEEGWPEGFVRNSIVHLMQEVWTLRQRYGVTVPHALNEREALLTSNINALEEAVARAENRASKDIPFTPFACENFPFPGGDAIDEAIWRSNVARCRLDAIGYAE